MVLGLRYGFPYTLGRVICRVLGSVFGVGLSRAPACSCTGVVVKSEALARLVYGCSGFEVDIEVLLMCW